MFPEVELIDPGHRLGSVGRKIIGKGAVGTEGIREVFPISDQDVADGHSRDAQMMITSPSSNFFSLHNLFQQGNGMFTAQALDECGQALVAGGLSVALGFACFGL